jgi:mannose-6-phosphate isomerase-like protein (cupin superfamily)
MTGYEVLNVGAPSEWRSFFGGFRPETSRDGRRVVDKEMDLQYMGLTVNALVAGEEAPYWHKHSQVEELYIFISGHGQMGLNEDCVEVTAGSIVRVSPETWIKWRCHPDSTEELRWLCVRAGGMELPDAPNDATVDFDRPNVW